MNRTLFTAQWLARASLALLFAYAGIQKLLDPGGFAQDIDHYRVLPAFLVGPLALGLPVLELVAAAALVTSGYVRGGALLCALMLTVFAGAMAQAKLRGIDLECGCFGGASKNLVSWGQVARNAGLAILSAWLVRPLYKEAAPAPAELAS
jgi:uncharacterized membrane protein YphA (DoxX/SURF4 family)